MKIIESIKKGIQKYTNKKDKMDILMNVIDSIEINEQNNSIHIKTSKNLIFENNGHSVFATNGINVQLADVIQLNPKIQFNGDFEDLPRQLQEAELKELS